MLPHSLKPLILRNFTAFMNCKNQVVIFIANYTFVYAAKYCVSTK